MKSDEQIIKEFDERFELEHVGCSECGGTELIDLTELRFPKGKYYGEYDLEKIKSYILSIRKADREAVLKMIEEEINDWKGGGHITNIAGGAISALSTLKQKLQ